MQKKYSLVILSFSFSIIVFAYIYILHKYDNCRVLETTPEKEIVWEFINPNHIGKNCGLIST